MHTTTVERYIAINGFDRDMSVNPQRYRYTVSLTGYTSNGLHGTYKNIEWLSATSLIIPMEIVQPATSMTAPKPFFNQEFSLAVPYVMLAIDGFDGTYDGTNETIRRAFAMFVYHRSYKAPNGRGYVLMEPAQDERRVFQTPLASLRDLSVSILKPNGALFNNSVDRTMVSMLQYDIANRILLKVVCETYFDRNEYYPGDDVMIRGFHAEPPSGGGGAGFASLNAYINRREGHEVVQLGPPNDQGFYKTFFILAPGVLDQGAGRVITDENMLSAVAAISATPSLVTKRGMLLNVSLQNVITLRVGTHASDPTPMIAPIGV